MWSSSKFNIDCGYFEGLARGFKESILRQSDYENLIQCETLEDIKLNLQSTDYAGLMATEQSPISVNLIEEKIRDKLVNEFLHIRNQAKAPLSTFLDYITYAYMIDNVVLLITGIVNNRPISELINKCHPLGSFDQIEALHVASTPEELYTSVMIDTPIAPFFRDCINEQDMSELNIEIIRNSLFKSYIESFYEFCQTLGGTTADVMCEILAFEADRRCFNITINSLDSSLTVDDRISLYPTCGLLNPYGMAMLAKAEDFDHVRQVSEYYAQYKVLFEGQSTAATNPDGRALEDKFTEYEVKLNVNSFMQQFHYGVFYSAHRLKEQECRNIVWISECVAQSHRQKIDHYIPILY
ncbi:hypothetical protein GZH46_02818, partial [Fragariocoptes setiger]